MSSPPPPPPTTTDDIRICDHCLSVKPLAEFRRRSRGGPSRMNDCRACHNRAERRRRAGQRSRKEQREMAAAMNALIAERDDERLKLLACVMVHEFGGLEGFLVAWSEYHERAMERGGLAALRCIELVVRLVEYCDASRAKVEDVSDDELERSAMEHVRQVIEEHPELSVAAAREAGWRVEPPGVGR